MKKLTQILIVCTLTQAIQSIRSGAEWNLSGDQYSGLQWLDKTQTKPSQKEVDQAMSNCLAAETTKETQKKQAVQDAEDTTKDAQARLDALIKALDLK